MVSPYTDQSRDWNIAMSRFKLSITFLILLSFSPLEHGKVGKSRGAGDYWGAGDRVSTSYAQSYHRIRSDFELSHLRNPIPDHRSQFHIPDHRFQFQAIPVSLHVYVRDHSPCRECSVAEKQRVRVSASDAMVMRALKHLRTTAALRNRSSLPEILVANALVVEPGNRSVGHVSRVLGGMKSRRGFFGASQTDEYGRPPLEVTPH